jgi:hypothetical protein
VEHNQACGVDGKSTSVRSGDISGAGSVGGHDVEVD